MKIKLQNKDSLGFAIAEIFLSIMIIAAVAGLTVIYFTKLNQSTTANTNTNSDTRSSSQPLTQITAPNGTTDNINQLLQQALEAEKNIDTSVDTSILNNANSSNSAITNIGGAYDASNL